MGNMVIQGTEIQIKEYGGQRVVTFKDIDRVHQRPDGTAARNFKTNRKRFISGVDYFIVSTKDVGTDFVQTCGFSNRAPCGTLITESGYLMLVKSFTDDLAWKVQRELVDTYFRARVDEETVMEAVEAGIPTLVIDTDKLIRCAEIMSACLEGNRPYVLNILRNIIPDVGDTQDPVAAEACASEDVRDVTVKTLVTVSQDRISNKGCGVPFNFRKLGGYLVEKNIKDAWLAEEIGVSERTISNWRLGHSAPGEAYRNRLCRALGVSDGYFNGETRKRKHGQQGGRSGI